MSRGLSRNTPGFVLDNVISKVIADTPTAVAHNLGRIPDGFIVVDLKSTAAVSGICSVTNANSISAWTATNAYLKANGAGTSAKVIFV